MDLFTTAIFLLIACLSGIIVYFTSIYGVREKTYEEAIAEQRKMPNDELLIGRPKEKFKDKKDKKRLQKKVKEKKKGNIKKESKEAEETIEKEVTEVSNHVNFVEPEVEILEKPIIHVPDEKKKKKKEKIKPILVNKEEPIIIAESVVEAIPANHFDKIIPKDDLMMRKSSKSESQDNINEVQEKVSMKTVTQEKNEKKKLDKQLVIKKVEAEDPVPSTSSSAGNNSPVAQIKPAKESKKKAKKNDGLNIHLMAPESINLQCIANLIRQATLTHEEVQTLTDVLLNKQLDDCLNPSEWIEGPQDPVVKLKKQLAEKEEALDNEKASSQALQSKLKELRTELNGERAKIQQTIRQYEEAIIAKQAETQALHQRLNSISIQFESDKQGLSQKLQQAQNQYKDDQMIIRKLQEDFSQSQNAYQQELKQRNKLEIHITRLQEAENAIQTQIHGALAERDQANVSLNSEIQKSRRLEEENLQLQAQIKNLVENSSHQQELARQFEELSRNKQDVEKILAEARHNIDDLQFEKNRLQAELHTLTSTMSNYLKGDWESRAKKAELRITEREKDVQRATSRVNELQTDLDRIVSERDCLQRNCSQWAKQVEDLEEQLTAASVAAAAAAASLVSSERSVADGQENGGSPIRSTDKDPNTDFINHEATSKQKDIIVEQLKEELLQKENMIGQLSSELQARKAELTTLAADFAKQKTGLAQINAELDAQKAKNNDLRQKNWKAVEALNNTEKALDTRIKDSEKVLNSKTEEARVEEQQVAKAFMERLFPDIKISEKNYSKWINAFEVRVKTEVSNLKNSPASSDFQEKITELEKQKSQLEGLVTHYKSIIIETEGMLNKLQQHVEQEEIRWNEQLAAKQAELEEAKQNRNPDEKVKAQIEVLEEDLEEVKKNRDAEISALKSEIEIIQSQNAEYSEKFTTKCNEAEIISSKLSAEIERNKDLNKEIVKLRSNLKIGQDSFEAEKRARMELEEQLKVLSCNSLPSANDNSVPVTLPRSSETPNENPVKKKNKKRKNGSEGSAA